LHSTAQKNLLKTFEELISNCKLVYTTHSHHLINPKWLNGAYIVRNKSLNYKDEFSFDSEKTDIEAIPYKQFVAKYPKQQDYFQPILDTLDYQPGLLEKVPEIIVTEGKNDFYTLKYFNEVVFSNKYKKLNFFPGNGANQNFAVISLYLAWGKHFIILLDSDKAGIDAKKKYINEFGAMVSSQILTYKELVLTIGDVAMEGIFSEEEKLNITQSFDSTSKKYSNTECIYPKIDFRLIG